MLRRLLQSTSIAGSSTSLLPSRAASSCAPSNSSSSAQCRPNIAGRGRAKQAGSVSTRLFVARQNREKQPESAPASTTSSLPRLGKGRTKRRHYSAPSPPLIDLGASLKGSASDALHLGLTPGHLPLPIPLGAEQYFGQPGSDVNPIPTVEDWISSPLGPFDASLPSKKIMRGDVLAMVNGNGDRFDSHRTGLNDHLHVMYALARPGRSHHLGATNSSSGDFFDSDLPTLSSAFTSAINEAGARNSIAAGSEWESVLARLGSRQPAPGKEQEVQEVRVSEGERRAVDTAVADLDSLLADLQLDSTTIAHGAKRSARARMVAVVDEAGKEQWIRMDSTRRKRKKKMNKHKYKKRRDAQKALRKKLGK